MLVETIRIKIFGLAFWLCFDNWLANVKMLPSTILSWVQLSCDYRKCSYLNFRVIAIETSIAITLSMSTRNHLTSEQKEILLGLWEDGMTTVKRKDLLKKAVDHTDLEEQTIRV
jgi:hypothetical protein